MVNEKKEAVVIAKKDKKEAKKKPLFSLNFFPAKKNSDSQKKNERKETAKSEAALQKNIQKTAEEKKIQKAVEKTRSQAFSTASKKKRGWFAEREQHALVARGVEVRKKELSKYKIIYSVFIAISLFLAVFSLIAENILSFSISVVIIVFTFFCFMAAIDPSKRKMMIYVIVWPFVVGLAVSSLFKRNFISFFIAILAMSISSLTPALIKEKSRKEEIIKAVRELQKIRKPTETDFDKLLLLLQQFGKLKISEISVAFGIEHKKAEEWASIMEQSNLAVMKYPAFGEEELRKK